MAFKTLTASFEPSEWASVQDVGNQVIGHLLHTFETKARGETAFAVRTVKDCLVTFNDDSKKQKGKRAPLSTKTAPAGSIVCIKGAGCARKLEKFLATVDVDSDNCFVLVDIEIGAEVEVNGGPNAGKTMRDMTVRADAVNRSEYESFMGDYAETPEQLRESMRLGK